MMKAGQIGSLAVRVAALLLLQGCYVKWGDETIIGQEDTAFPGASIEKGCVVKIEPVEWRSFPPKYKVLLQDPNDRAKTFSRNAGASHKLEVGNCYEWKLGIRDPSLEDMATDPIEGMREISSDTVREIHP
jgi:carbonic anhydrase/acetyltransferase-like protein (isoleucine patch superfamily)